MQNHLHAVFVVMHVRCLLDSLPHLLTIAGTPIKNVKGHLPLVRLSQLGANICARKLALL